MAVSTEYAPGALQQRNLALFSFLRGAENVIIFLAILYYTGAIGGLLFVDLSNLENESPAARLMWYPIYIATLALSVRILPQLIRIVTFNPLIVLCVLWCGVSIFWSIDAAVSMRRAVALLMTTLMGLFLAARYDWSGFVQRLGFAFSALVVIVFLVVLIDPQRGISQEIHVGAWRGPWTEKNYLGSQMTRGLVIMMCAFAMRPDRGWFWIPMGGLCLLLVLLSTSKTALLACLLAISMFLFIRFYRRYPVLRVLLVYLLFTGIAIFVTLAIFIPGELLALIGKDPTLTGRTDIWDALVLSIKEKPWLGFGYGVYWLDLLGPSYYVRLSLQWGVPTAHNGWIETWLSVGAVGVILFAVLYVWTFVLAIMRLKRGGTETYWAIIISLTFLVFSLSESSVLQQNDLSWVIFVATTAKLFAFERPFWRDRVSQNYFTQIIPTMISRK
ncbi:MAG: O-antigen ligase [Litorimonas sp.]